jgi:2',3'-cyclic-nucleotide 2'-phosphodiesterase (5'-nucleotidase family)
MMASARARSGALRIAVLAIASLAACGGPSAAPAVPDAEELPPRPSAAPRAVAPPSAPPAPARVTLLFTSDEHGWLLPAVERGVARGGAAEALGQWIAAEGHCPGPPPPGEAAPPPPPACADPGTLLLSGGDDFTGPAITTYFGGEPMARAMGRMGYAAAAFGNHELDFGRDHFVANRRTAGVAWLAANLRAKDPQKSLDVPPYALFHRRGVTIGVVGLATDTTLRAARASHFDGLAFDDEEPALARAVPAAWEAGADAVVLVAHECAERLEPMLARHPEWHLAFAGAGHCHDVVNRRVGDVALASPGWRLDHYVRVRLAIDPARPPRERVVSAEPAVIDVAHPEGARAPARDEPLARDVERWRERVDRELGQPIGFAARTVDRDDPALARFVAETWREALHADVAVVNSGGIRQALPAGVIEKSTVWSILPFDDRLVLCTLTGRQLAAELRHEQAVAVGVKDAGGGRLVDGKGRPIEPSRRYTVATIDFLYLGGAGFRLQEDDPGAHRLAADWRAPVIAWLEAHPSTPARPLDLR